MRTISIIISMCLFTFSATARCVNVKQVTANYKNQSVTFILTWTGCNNTTNLNKVWCLVDFQTVDAAGNKGTWARAAINGAATVNNGTYTAGNATGFYVTGKNEQSATVTVKLGNVSGRFNWCAYATDYPPNIGAANSGVYTLRGTQSFVIGGNTISGKQYSGTIATLTDATGCPGCIAFQNFKFSSSNVSIPCCPNLTAVGGYCRDLAADAASTYIGCGIEIKAADAGLFCGPVNNGCTGDWRWPNSTELQCIIDNKAAVGNIQAPNYWSSTYAGSCNSHTDYWTYLNNNSSWVDNIENCGRGFQGPGWARADINNCGGKANARCVR